MGLALTLEMVGFNPTSIWKSLVKSFRVPFTPWTVQGHHIFQYWAWYHNSWEQGICSQTENLCCNLQWGRLSPDLWRQVYSSMGWAWRAVCRRKQEDHGTTAGLWSHSKVSDKDSLYNYDASILFALNTYCEAQQI